MNTLNSNRKKTINLFAIGIILLVAVPEIIGQTLFEKPHPENSSVIAAVSTFGVVGGTATSFLTNYETPLRLVSIAILCITYYASVKSITTQCKIVK